MGTERSSSFWVYVRRCLSFGLSVILAFQTFIFSPGIARAVADTTPPTIDTFVAAASAGLYQQQIGDNIYTNDSTPTISATYSDDVGINATSASIRVDGDSAGFDSRDTSGISATLTSLADGEYSVEVVVSDTAVPAHETTATKNLFIDTVNPSAPVIPAPGSVTSKNQAPTVSGTTEADSVVKIYDSASLVATDSTTSDGNFSVPTSSLAEGDHTLTATATDLAGNVSVVSNTVSYTVDLTAPAIPTLVAEPDTNNSTPTLDWNNVTDAAQYHIQIATNGAFSPVLVDQVIGSNLITVPSPLPNGTIDWRVSSIDAYGNESGFSADDSFVIDNALPVVTTVGLLPISPIKAGLLTMTIDFNKPMNTVATPTVILGSSSASVSWTDSDTLSATVTVPSDHSLDGTKTITISGNEDTFGNVMAADSSHSAVIDTTAPVITLNGSTTQTLEAGTAYSEQGAVWTDANDGSGSAVISGDTVNIHVVGDYHISYDKTDAAGNIAETVIRTVHVQDTVKPVFSDASPVDLSTTSDVHTLISGTFTDNGSYVNHDSIDLYVDGFPMSSSDVSWSGDRFTFNRLGAYDDGIHDITVFVADNAGNTSETAAWSFTISAAPTILSAASTGGRVISTFVNRTNTGFHLSGDVTADDGGVGEWQTVQLFSNYVDSSSMPIATTIVLPGITTYSIDLSSEELAALTSSDGVKNLQVLRIGHTGNMSDLSAVTAVTVDMAAPSQADQTKVSVAQNAPGNADTISGIAGAVAETSGTVYFYQANGATEIAHGSVAPDGSFGPLSIGDNANDTVKVAVRDLAGNESALVAKTNDIVAPAAPVITSPTDNTISQNGSFTVTGTAEAGTTVTISNSGNYGSGLVNESGNFIIPVTLPGDNSYSLEAKAVDAAANQSASSNIVNYLLDTTTPVAMVHSPIGLTNNSSAPVSVTWSETGSGFAADPTRTLHLGVLSKATVWNGSDAMTYTPSSSSADGVKNVTATITDKAGNVGSVSFSYTIDATAPVIAAHENMTVEATSAAGASVDYIAPIATDNYDSAASATCLTNSGSVFPIGDTVVTCTKTDTAGNMALLTNFTVTVHDTTAPTITVTGDNPLTVQVHGSYTDPGAIAHDAVDGDFAATATDSVNKDVVGNYTVSYDAVDAHGNHAITVTRTVHIVDTTAPVIAAHGDETVEATSPSGATVTYTAPDATDNYDATASAICTPASGSNFPIGTTLVTCTKTDANGNTATPVTFNVIVRDTTAPVLTEITPVTTPTNNPHYVFNSTEAGTITYLGTCSATTATTTATVGTNNVALSGLGTGTYGDCQIKVTDAHSNQSSALSIPAFVIDMNAPTVTVDTLATKDSTPALSGTVNDPLATISVAVNGVDYAAVNNGATWTIADNTVSMLPDGIYNVAATATDTLGNIGHDATTNELTIDNLAPSVVPASASPSGTIAEKRPLLTATLTDAVSGVKADTVVMRVNGVDVSAGYNASTGVVSFAPVRDLLVGRKYTVTIDTKDNLGNTMTRYSFNFTISN